MIKETNMEHFRSEIEAIFNAGGTLALKDGVPARCRDIGCIDCEFSMCNDRAKIQWAMSEYKPEPMLTAREKHFVECLEDGWLTKGEACNEFKWWEKKPRREGKRWVSDVGSKVHGILSYAFEIKLSFITWEDESPWSVADLRKLKVGEADD